MIDDALKLLKQDDKVGAIRLFSSMLKKNTLNPDEAAKYYLPLLFERSDKQSLSMAVKLSDALLKHTGVTGDCRDQVNFEYGSYLFFAHVDIDKGLSLLIEASRSCSDACVQLSKIYKNGLHCEVDYAESLHWLDKAMELGSIDPCIYVLKGDLFYSGGDSIFSTDIPRDLAKAEECWIKANELGADVTERLVNLKLTECVDLLGIDMDASYVSLLESIKLAKRYLNLKL
ncbi:SEL1-like repeat protein [Photobacterium leiognathi]|uniref:hypothetical protein n=1 Tax=Photobacterium leiognathi TaxID=553611 RepID=UPI002980BDFC|nr:hypothetical protein [Photobacterium leiognathi]